MADPLEWYAVDSRSPGVGAGPVLEFMEEIPFNSVIWGQTVGLSGAVVWSTVWEPLSGSDFQPATWPNEGPLAVGHVPTVMGSGGGPSTYVPTNENAIGVGLLTGYGVFRLRATVGGVPVPGELVMTIVDGGTAAYPDLTLTYSTGTPVETAFWTEFQNTYEIP